MTILSEPVTAPLAGLGRLPDWLTAAMDADRVRAALESHVPELRSRLTDCAPDRLRAKDERWLARYTVRLRDPDGSTREVVLTGVLHPDGLAAAERPAGTVPFGDPAWRGQLPELGLSLRTQVADDELPALPQLTDPEAARELLERALGATRPGIRLAGCEPDVVRYKPGSRCTVVYRLRYEGVRRPDWPELVVGKTHHGDKGANAYAAMRALWDTELAAGRVVTIAEPLAFVPELRVLVQGPVAEQVNLKDLVGLAVADDSAAALDQLRTALHRTADGLAALHGVDVRHGRVHRAADELDEISEIVDRLSRTVPEVRDAAAPLVARLRQLDAAVPADPHGPAHHDFRPGQVLLDGARIGFIDFDGFCTAEPALDLGRFRAKLRDIGMTVKDGRPPLVGAALRRRLDLLDDLCEDFLTHYQRHRSISRQRVELWETADLLTALLHAWTKVRVARVAPRLALLEAQVKRVIES